MCAGGAFSYSYTLINCSAEIEAIHGSKRQKQTDDCWNGVDFCWNAAPSVSPYKWLLSILPIFISPDAHSLFLPEINGFPLRVVTMIKSKRLTFFRSTLISSSFIIRAAGLCVFLRVQICLWNYVCTQHWSCFAATSILSCLQLEWWLDSVTHQKVKTTSYTNDFWLLGHSDTLLIIFFVNFCQTFQRWTEDLENIRFRYFSG